MYLDPAGSKPPTLSSDVKWSGIERRHNQAFGLACLAQGSPVPKYRFVGHYFHVLIINEDFSAGV